MTTEQAISPATHTNRRLTVAMLGALASYAGLVAIVLLAILTLIGRGVDINHERTIEVFWSMHFHGILAALCATVALIVRRRITCGPTWPKLALLISVLCVVASIDRIAGILYPPPSQRDSIYAPHERRGWTHRRRINAMFDGGRSYLNALGMRGPEVPHSKPPEEFRILFLGDSVTFGVGLSEEHTFAHVAADLLEQAHPDRRFRCVNTGVAGYTTWQELDVLRNEGLSINPDLVVLAFCFNDVIDLIALDPGTISGRAPIFAFSNDSHWSGLVRAIRSIRGRKRFNTSLRNLRWQTEEPTGGPDRPFQELTFLLHNADPADLEKAWARILVDLTEIDKLCKSRGIPWMLVALPVRAQLEQDDVTPASRTKLRTLADSLRVTYLDLNPAFRRAADTRALDDLFGDDIHLTEEGNRIIAAELVRFLVEHELIEGPVERR